MKKQYDIEEEIERTLQSLDGIQPATPKPFFYTRLQGRMEQRLLTKKSWLFRPVYAFSALGLVLLLNFMTIYTFTHSTTQSSATPENFAKEYGLNSVGGIDLN